MMGLLSRLNPFRKSVEGGYAGPSNWWSHWGNPFSVSSGDGFQLGLTPQSSGPESVAAVYACVSQTARSVALCDARHMVKDGDGLRRASTSSPTSRILRYANGYQTFGQFIYNVSAQMDFHGEAFALIQRDDRFAPVALHLYPPNSCSPYVDQATGDIYYSIGSNPMLPSGGQMMAPARDIIHFRLHTPRHPLIGETPLRAAALAMGINVSVSASQAAFFSRMSRPSGILSTDVPLTAAQLKELRAAFDAQATGMNQGGIPVLAGGLKFSPMSITATDAQLLESQRFSVEEIARCFGVPLLLIGAPSSQTASSSESLINFWLSTALGSRLENIEATLERAFGLSPSERIEFDEKALLRTDLAGRMEAYSKGVQGGIYSPNEARGFEGLPPVAGGDGVFLQRQMVNVDLLDELAANELKAPEPAPAPPAPEPEPEEDPEDTKMAMNKMLVEGVA